MQKRGFTLIELLIVIAILAVLTGVVLVAVSPGRQMSQARNAERWAEANTLLNAVSQYQIDNGAFPSCVTTTVQCIGAGPCVGEASSCDLSGDIVPTYIAELPKDSLTGTDADNGYNIITTGSPSYRITLSSPDAELGLTISVTR